MNGKDPRDMALNEIKRAVRAYYLHPSEYDAVIAIRNIKRALDGLGEE